MIVDCQAGDHLFDGVNVVGVYDRATGECLNDRHITYADDDRGFYRACVLLPNGNLQVDPEDEDRVWQREYAADIKIRLLPEFATDPDVRRWFAARKEASQ